MPTKPQCRGPARWHRVQGFGFVGVGSASGMCKADLHATWHSGAWSADVGMVSSRWVGIAAAHIHVVRCLLEALVLVYIGFLGHSSKWVAELLREAKVEYQRHCMHAYCVVL
jgi:hypothetical protein